MAGAPLGRGACEKREVIRQCRMACVLGNCYSHHQAGDERHSLACRSCKSLPFRASLDSVCMRERAARATGVERICCAPWQGLLPGPIRQ